jgi:hypothetical protein
LIGIKLHASTYDLLHALLTALAKMNEGTAPALTAEQRSYFAQAVDLSADLDIVLDLLVEALSVAVPTSSPDDERRP